MMIYVVKVLNIIQREEQDKMNCKINKKYYVKVKELMGFEVVKNNKNFIKNYDETLEIISIGY